MPERILDLEWVRKAMTKNKEVMAQVAANTDMDNMTPTQEYYWNNMQREMMLLTNLRRLMRISKNEDLGHILQVLAQADKFIQGIVKLDTEMLEYQSKEGGIVHALNELRAAGIID